VRSSSTSDVVMEPFITERAKGDEPQNHPHTTTTPDASQQPHLTPTFSQLTASSLAAPPPPPHSPTSDPLASYDTVLSSSLDELGDGVSYDHLWPGLASRGRASNSDWASVSDSALVFSPDREMEEEEGETGGEEDDLYSSIRDYLTQRGAERREEAAVAAAGEKEGVAGAADPIDVPLPTPVQTGIARTQVGPLGQVQEVRQAVREDRQAGKDGRQQVSRAVRRGSEDSGEDTEAEQRSIYECLELQCEWPSPSSSSSLERRAGRRENRGGSVDGETGEQRADGERGREDKEVAAKSSTSQERQLVRQEPVDMDPGDAPGPPCQTPSPPDAARGKLPRGRPKKRQASGVHVSFRPSTESVQFHNPLESKEAHWRARLRRLSHFHTYSHSAGERLVASPGAKAGAGSLGGVPGVNHRAGPHETAASGELSAPGSSGGGDGSGAGGQECGDEDEERPAGGAAHSEKPSGSGGSSGVRVRLGRSGLRPRVSRSRSQEPGGGGPRHHHQVALLGGVYKTVVHALSSKPRPRGQGSSQGSSPQRQVRGASGDAPLRDLYSHVLGYFGRKTAAAAAGEDCCEPDGRPLAAATTPVPQKKHQQNPIKTSLNNTNTCNFLFRFLAV